MLESKNAKTPEAKTYNLRHLTQNPQRNSVEYRLRWVPNAIPLRRPCTFNFVGVDFICVWRQRKPRFQWNMGLRPIPTRPIYSCPTGIGRFPSGDSRRATQLVVKY